MTIFVDDLFTMEPRTERARKFGNRWCHMASDGELEELHAMAQKIGLNRAMFQPHATLPHYDLIPSKRALAIRYGAIAIPAHDLAVKNFEAHKPRPGEQVQEPAPAIKPTLEYRERRRKCQMRYNKKQAKSRACENLTHWVLMPKDIAICRTCALYLASNNQAEKNIPILAPMLGMSNIKSWEPGRAAPHSATTMPGAATRSTGSREPGQVDQSGAGSLATMPETDEAALQADASEVGSLAALPARRSWPGSSSPSSLATPGRVDHPGQAPRSFPRSPSSLPVDHPGQEPGADSSSTGSRERGQVDQSGVATPVKDSDPRTPVEVSQVGEFTVKIYDLARYRAMKRKYYSNEDSAS